MVHDHNIHGVGPNYYCSSQLYFSNGLPIDPNKDCIKTLHPREIDILVYHFGVHKNFGISNYRVMFRVMNR